MAHGLDIVSVRVEHEGAVIVRVIMRPCSRRSVVTAAGQDRLAVEAVHGVAVMRGEGDVRAGLRQLLQSDPEEGLGADAIARGSFAIGIEARDSKGTQRAV